MSHYVHIRGQEVQAPPTNFEDKGFGRNDRWTKGDEATPYYMPNGEKRMRTTKREAFNSIWNTGGPVRTSTGLDEGYETELRDWYEQWDDDNTRQTQVLITRLRLSDMWPTTLALPWMLKTDGISLDWGLWQFNTSYLESLPEEAPARYMTNERKAFKAALRRVGNGITATAQQYNTPQGREEWGYKAEQIKNAILIGLNHAVILALIEADAWNQDQRPYELPPHSSTSSMAKAIAKEIEGWAIINKDDFGIKIMENKMVERFGQQVPLKTGNLLICPRGTQMHMDMAKMISADFSNTGWRQGEGPNALQKAISGRIYKESIAFPIGNHMADNDPVYNIRTIGTFNVMNDETTCGIDPKEYQSRYRDIRVYDEDTDNWKILSFASLIGPMGIWQNWDTDGHPFLSSIGRKLFEGKESLLECCQKMGPQYLDRVLDAVVANERAVDALRDIAEEPFAPDEASSLNREVISWRPGRDDWLSPPIPVAVGGAMDVDNAQSDDDDDDDDAGDHNSTSSSSDPDSDSDSGSSSGSSSDSDSDSGSSSSSSSDSDDDSNARPSRVKEPKDPFFQELKRRDDATPLSMLFVNYLKIAGKRQNSDYLERFQSWYRNQEPSKVVSAGISGWKSMGATFLAKDLSTALSILEEKNNTSGGQRQWEMSPLEKKLVADDADLDGSLKNYKSKDAASIRWLPDKQSSLKMYVEPYLSVEVSFPLPALATTFAATNTVLLSLEADDVGRLLRDGGLLHVDGVGDGSLRELALRYSVITSAIVERILMYLRSEERLPSEENDGYLNATEQDVLQDVKTLASSFSDTPTQVKMLSKNCTVATSQLCIKPLIEATKDLINAVLDSGASNDNDLDLWSSVLQIINCHNNVTFGLQDTLLLAGLESRVSLPYTPAQVAAGRGMNGRVRHHRARVKGVGAGDFSTRYESEMKGTRLTTSDIAEADMALDNLAKESGYNQQLLATVTELHSDAANTAELSEEEKHQASLVAMNRRAVSLPYYSDKLKKLYLYYVKTGVRQKRFPNADEAIKAWTHVAKVADTLAVLHEGLLTRVSTSRLVEEWLYWHLTHTPDMEALNQEYTAVTEMLKTRPVNWSQVPVLDEIMKTVMNDQQQDDEARAGLSSSRARVVASKGVYKINLGEKAGDVVRPASELKQTKAQVSEVLKVLASLRQTQTNGAALDRLLAEAGLYPADKDEKNKLTLQTVLIAAIQLQLRLYDKVDKEFVVGRIWNSRLRDPTLFGYLGLSLFASQDLLGKSPMITSLYDHIREYDVGNRKISATTWDASVVGSTGRRDNSSSSSSSRPSSTSAPIEKFSSSDNPRELRMKIKREFERARIEDGRYVKWMIAYNLPCFIGALLWRPSMRYEMGTAILMQSGGETGWTYHNEGRYTSGLDVKTDIMHGQFDMYAAPVVRAPQNLVRAFDCFCRDYLGGNGTRVYDNLSYQDNVAFQSGVATKDIYVAPMWADFRLNGQPFLDITGKFQQGLPASAKEQETTWYECAEELNKRWKFSHGAYNALDQRPIARHYRKNQVSKVNTICLQAVQFNYEHRVGGGGWTGLIAEQSHWGSNVGPGCRAARSGGAMTIPKQQYLQAA